MLQHMKAAEAVAVRCEPIAGRGYYYLIIGNRRLVLVEDELRRVMGSIAKVLID